MLPHLTVKMHFLKQNAKLSWSHLSYLWKWVAFFSLSFPGRSRRKSPDCRLNSVHPLTAAPNCASCIYLESKAKRFNSVCLEMKVHSGDEEGICLQVGKNWSSRHLSMIRARVYCWPGGVQQQAAGTAQPAHLCLWRTGLWQGENPSNKNNKYHHC